MWLVFMVYAPQLAVSYEVRLRFDDSGAWESLVLPVGKPATCFDGDCQTSACTFFDFLFQTLGSPGLVPSRN